MRGDPPGRGRRPTAPAGRSGRGCPWRPPPSPRRPSRAPAQQPPRAPRRHPRTGSATPPATAPPATAPSRSARRPPAPNAPTAAPAPPATAPSPDGASCPGRAGSPAAPRTGPAANAARPSATTPTTPSAAPAPRGPPRPPAAPASGRSGRTYISLREPCASTYRPLCRAKPRVRPARVQFDARQHVPRNRDGSTNVSASSRGWPCASRQSALSRRRLSDSARDARFGVPDASGSTRNRVLFPIRRRRRNCTERCHPSHRSRGPHLNAPDCQPASAAQWPRHSATCRRPRPANCLNPR